MAAAAGELGRGRPGSPVRLGGRYGQGGEALLYKVSFSCISYICFILYTVLTPEIPQGIWIVKVFLVISSVRYRNLVSEAFTLDATNLYISHQGYKLIYFTSGISF